MKTRNPDDTVHCPHKWSDYFEELDAESDKPGYLAFRCHTCQQSVRISQFYRVEFQEKLLKHLMEHIEEQIPLLVCMADEDEDVHPDLSTSDYERLKRAHLTGVQAYIAQKVAPTPLRAVGVNLDLFPPLPTGSIFTQESKIK